MRYYAVAYINFFDNENRVHVVRAESDAEAMLEAVKQQSGEAYADWADSMAGLSVDEIKNEVFNGDAAISDPLPL